ncbi:DUF6457 domain-containing protein [Streptomyces spectabilis]|uniref:Molybdenum cofactor guanylyltransferase n=1 Tax=Streptomyces spectabilis TaxID=68270 RepID=A0A5P2X9G0_STRST|nr:DUF6457 domain-containing protein [Streptomyces spectabilis]MBB5103860.1 molybdopterin-guanine dinucleotide biosynthesis protein A [Streptomyces spectabilis]MCI3903902.1 molybdenum cofactor guanylyltransferase [Streptomyces spectabilis]QEV61061.1 molybdenum cofactor guanylyltransferase [Streptomyces spectabilis]GGV18387.1 molybdenum cofactor guanylyltransferase [Streptomyces spectabilis]
MTSNTGPAVAFDAVVLAGGRAARLGGADKPGVRVGGRALLDRVLAACSGAATTVVVAAPRPTARPVVWAREEPAGGGPLAALDAGLRRTAADLVVVFSADLPFLRERTVRALVAAVGSGDGALLTDPDGRDQPLVAAYRSAALRRELARIAAGDPARAGSGLAGLPLRLLTERLDLARIAEPLAAFDCDTWDDIAAARARIREHGHVVLDEWISAVKDELGIDLDVDTGTLLDLARDAAHGVARPAAPLTTFLVGYAAGLAGASGGPQAVAEAARKAAALAARWAEEGDTGGAPASGAPTGAASTGAASGAPAGAAPDDASGSPHAAPADENPGAR